MSSKTNLNLLDAEVQNVILEDVKAYKVIIIIQDLSEIEIYILHCLKKLIYLVVLLQYCKITTYIYIHVYTIRLFLPSYRNIMHIVQYLTLHVLILQRSGGGTLVENSTFGLSRNMDFVVKVAKETDVHIVAGTGVYTRY